MYSKEHIKFIKREMHKNIFVRMMQIIILLIFIAVWQLLADLELINTFISSSPSKVINTIITLHKSDLYHHIFVTVYETIISFGLGTLIGIIIAAILWWNKTLYRIVDPYLTIINSLPKVALGPIIIIWCGAGIKSIVLMALLISVVITIINVTTSFNEIDPNKIRLMKSFKASKKQIFFKLILPGSFNNIISALKVNISMSLIGVIMGEFLVSKEGLGHLIMYGSQVFNLDLVITGIFLLCIISAIMYYIVLYIEKKLKF